MAGTTLIDLTRPAGLGRKRCRVHGAHEPPGSQESVEKHIEDDVLAPHALFGHEAFADADHGDHDGDDKERQKEN